MDEIKEFLQESLEKFEAYLDDVKKHKFKMVSPKVQGQVMASAGCIAFIKEMQTRFFKEDTIACCGS